MKNLLLTVCIMFALTTAGANNLKPVEGDTPSPPLKLKDIQGKPHDLRDYKGKVVLVQFWGTYCPPCRKEMPSMNRLQKKMGDTPFAILAVNMGEPEETVQSFINEVKPDFTILLDPEGVSIGDWKIFAAPSNFIVAPDGKIHYTLYGGVEWDADELVSKLKALATQ